MKDSFYDLLQVPPDSDPANLKRAYQDGLASRFRRIRAAREQGQDISRLEEERILLDEAWSVLSDPARRSRYDRFLSLSERPLPREAEDLWSSVSGSFLDPTARSTLELVRILTSLPIGGEEARPGARPAPPPIRLVPAPPKNDAGPEVAKVPPVRAPTPRPEVVPAPDASMPTLADRKLPAWRSTAPTPSATGPSAPVPGDLTSLVMRFGYSGELIKRVRESRNITLEQVASQTRISIRYLEAIEADEHSRLPASTFVRGYLKEVARILGLDAEALSNGYLARLNRSRG